MAKVFSDAAKQRRIEERGLIEKCEELALKGRMTHREERDCRTHTKWEYKEGTFEIFLESGFYHLGNGREIRVVHDGEEVFHAYDAGSKEEKYPHRPTFKVEDLHIGTYVTGSWEEEIAKILIS